VIVKLRGEPGQPFAEGVTVIVAVTGTLVILIAVNDGISPVPLAAKPMEVLLFVQLKPVPLTAPVKFTALVATVLHNVWLAGCTTSGVGFTVIVKLCTVPGHPYAIGKTFMVAVAGVLLTFTAVKGGISPVPLTAKPIEVLLLVQIKLVAPTLPVKFTALVGAALHMAWLVGCTTFGVGFTVIVKNRALPGQPFAVGITVMNPVAGTIPELTAVKEGIFPLPVAANPIEVLLLVQLKPVPLTVPEKFIAPIVPLLQIV